MDFDTVTADEVDRADPVELDHLPFGVIGFGASHEVELYSSAESRMAGLPRDKVLGRHVFSVVAPCMNNFMVAERFENEPELDATIDFVLTFRMHPTRVKLRLLQRAKLSRAFILVLRV